jgi:hypothetical protein
MGVRIPPKRGGIQAQREDHTQSPIVEIFELAISNPR